MPSITVLTVREDNLLLVYRKWQISLQIELPPRRPAVAHVVDWHGRRHPLGKAFDMG